MSSKSYSFKLGHCKPEILKKHLCQIDLCCKYTQAFLSQSNE